MSDVIQHSGTVDRIDGEVAHVHIVQSSACSACHAAKACMAADRQDKWIDAVCEEPLQVGDEVEVVVKQRAGWLAVLLAYIVPFMLLVLMVWLLSKTGLSEAVTGTMAILAVAVYYSVLRLFRAKLNRRFVFTATRRTGVRN